MIASSGSQVTGALAGGDGPLAERLAHTLKGVAGNIGAMQVHAAAGVLEKAGASVIGSGEGAANVAE
jgi:HPt (histidine-containing phosphotransfer) domain-containing protein